MAINYAPVGWDTSKYINPTNMNQMDAGIKAACDAADQINTNLKKFSTDNLDNATFRYNETDTKFQLVYQGSDTYSVLGWHDNSFSYDYYDGSQWTRKWDLGTLRGTETTTYEDYASLIIAIHNSLNDGETVHKNYVIASGDSVLVIGGRYIYTSGRYIVLQRSSNNTYIYQMLSNNSVERISLVSDKNYTVCTGTTVEVGKDSVFNLPSGWLPSNCYPISAYYHNTENDIRFSCINDVWFDKDTNTSGRLSGQSVVGVPFYVVLAKIPT